MKDYIESFPEQLRTAIQIGQSAKISFKGVSLSQVCLSGLGGSGIGGSLVQDYVSGLMKIPFVVNKSYEIPRSVNAQTLFIACSYSGNTEETLAAVKQARKVKALIVCITSGGKLQKFAEQHAYPCILIPSGMPPRACLGYSVTQILYVLAKAGLIQKSFEKEFQEAILTIEKHSTQLNKQGLKLAQKLSKREVLLYTTVGHEGLTVRFKQQLNENSKMLAAHNVIPEMTHNEIVGWRDIQKQRTVVCISAPNDYSANLRRMNFLKKVIKTCQAEIIDMQLLGESFWKDALIFIHLTDWVSWHLSVLNEKDAVEVKVIDRLKSEMSKK
jgi:glucose/mannose-6-phosphate isomerase